MNKARVLLGLGIWVALLPYLGFPYFFKSILFVFTGLGMIYFSFLLYKENKNDGKKIFENFSENLSYSDNELS